MSFFGAHREAGTEILPSEGRWAAPRCDLPYVLRTLSYEPLI
jgi:hypothetical protein